MKNKRVPLLALGSILLLIGAVLAPAQEPKKPAIGAVAPLFVGQDQDGKPWKLAEAAGKRVVLLYFYPKDETPGCTKEACGLRDRMGDLKQATVEVVGVSFDNAESHQKFIANHNLGFTLLADTEGNIADAFGVRMPGKTWRGGSVS